MEDWLEAIQCQMILIFASNIHLLKNQTRYVCFKWLPQCLCEKEWDWKIYRGNCQFFPKYAWPQYSTEIALVSVTKDFPTKSKDYSQVCISLIFLATFDTSDPFSLFLYTISLLIPCHNILVIPPFVEPFLYFQYGNLLFYSSLKLVVSGYSPSSLH